MGCLYFFRATCEKLLVAKNASFQNKWLLGSDVCCVFRVSPMNLHDSTQLGSPHMAKATQPCQRCARFDDVRCCSVIGVKPCRRSDVEQAWLHASRRSLAFPRSGCTSRKQFPWLHLTQAPHEPP
ncbi:unnamed protein product [Symbiodinium natans]|uniref:Uncharacterized protein n=1 Tax=Symbiodinium natans TaxID=878477 RepID=A0A812M472_9DINO|nr:unnamed protein product [Symbiodinium natans]